MQPRRTPTNMATAIRDTVIEWFFSLVSNASLRPAIDVYQISIGNLKVNGNTTTTQPLELLFLGGTTNKHKHIITLFLFFLL